MAKSTLIAGIDVGSSKIGTLIAQVNEEEGRVHIVGAATSPSRGIKKGQVVNIEEAAQSIITSVEAAERMAGYNLAKAYVSIGGAHIISQNSSGVVAVAQPQGEISPQDVDRVMESARAISLPEAREILHCLAREFSVDSQGGIKDPLGMTGIRLEVDTHIITGSSTAVRNLTKCVGEVGSDIEELVFTGLASSYSTMSETERELGAVLLDIGAGTTSLAIFVDGSLSYSGVLPIGARNVTNDLAIGLRVSLESAEKIKLHLGKVEKKPVEAEAQPQKETKDEIDLSDLHLPEDVKTVSRKTLVDGIVKPRLNEIFHLVGQEIKKSNLSGLTPAGLIVTGGGALTVGIVESGKRTLAMPVRIGTPQGLTGLIDEVETPEFAVSTGLILYGFRSLISPLKSSNSGPKVLEGIPKGLAGRVSNFVKSLLP